VKSGRLELNDYLQSVSTRPYMPPAMPRKWARPSLRYRSHDRKSRRQNMLEGNTLSRNYTGPGRRCLQRSADCGSRLERSRSTQTGLGCA